MNKINSKSLIFILIVFFVALGLIAGLFYYNIKKHASITVLAVVKYVGNDYIVVEDENLEEYSLETHDSYNVGDKISFVIKDIKKDSNPKEGTVEKIDTVSKSVQFSIMDNGSDTNASNSVIDEQNQDSNIDSSLDTTSGNSLSNEEEIVAYFENLDKNLDLYSQNKSLGQSVKEGFVAIVDFLFYEGTIKGKMFHELSASAKIKILKIAFSIDQKIDQYFPGYKEEISSTSNKIYTNVKAKLLESYLDITTEVCENQPDTCVAAKQGLSDLKANFSLTWNFVKDISGVGISKLKSWYEVWKDA